MGNAKRRNRKESQMRPAAGEESRKRDGWNGKVFGEHRSEKKGGAMITSAGNAQMKRVAALIKKAKERRAERLFVVEGRKMYEEAPKEWISAVYVSESFLKEAEETGLSLRRVV